jgi:hypothetical protein
MRSRTIQLHFPLGGLNRRYAFQSQPPYTTPLCLNVWPQDAPTGRERGGVRPGLAEIGDCTGGVSPNFWCPASYIDTTESPVETKIAILVQSMNGTYLSNADATSWTELISTNVTTDFSSCAVYLNYAYQASGGVTAVKRRLVDASAAQEDLTIDVGVSVPTKCGLVLAHMDRLWLAGDTDNPHVLYASAVGRPRTWDYTEQSIGGAWTSSGAQGGILQEPIIALISHTPQLLLVAGTNSITAVVGNPRTGNQRVVSPMIGPLTPTSWCHDAQGNCYFLSKDGLYRIPAGGTTCEAISREKIPNELIGLTPPPYPRSDVAVAGDRISLGYDHRWRMVHIYVEKASGSDIYYTYDLQSGGFWPMEFSTNVYLAPTFPQAMTANRSSILTVSSIGEVHQYDRGNLVSVEDFDSYLLIGPIKLADVDGVGVLHSATATLANGSDNVKWQVYVGDTTEQAYDKAADASDPDFEGSEWSYETGRYLNYMQHVRKRGNVAYIRIYNSVNTEWLIEDIVVRILAAGRRRV